MKSRFTWLRSLFGKQSDPTQATQKRESGAGAALDLLEQARSLHREGQLQEASDVYGSIKRRNRTVDGLVEHAELLLSLGDHFGAASKAASALEKESGNARALAVQREILKREEAEDRRG